MRTRILSILALLLMTAAGAVAQTYTVTVKEGTADATKWTISPSSAAAGVTVTATYSGKLKVKSVKAVKKAIKVTSITLNKTATSIAVGSTETLSVSSILPENATNKTYAWSSSNATVATVNASGVVTAKAAGEATIKATANDGSGVTATCAVTVTPKLSTTEEQASSGLDVLAPSNDVDDFDE